jgi:hypothetical protein
MEGMFLAESGIQNPVIPDLAQPADWATYRPGYTLEMREAFVGSYSALGLASLGACIFDILASSVSIEDFRAIGSRLNSGVDYRSIAQIQNATSDCENGTLFSLTDSTKEDWDADQEPGYASEEISTTPTEVQRTLTEQYMDALSSWSAAGFERMMELSAPGSPAWSYAFHLRSGRTSELQSGWRDGSQLRLIQEQDSFRLCLTSSCTTKYSDFQVSDKVLSFKVNDRSLSESVVTYTDGSTATCSDYGFCVTARSVFWTGTTAFVNMEVSVDGEAVEAIGGFVRLVLQSGEKFKMTSGTTPIATVSEGAVYSMGFKGAGAPWGGLLVVEIKTNLGSERLQLRL